MAPRPGGTLRVASYNIHRAIGTDRHKDPARIASVLSELGSDILGLQEVDWHHDHRVDEAQFEYLAHLPGYRAIAGPNLIDHRGHYGNLLLTRLPVRTVRQIDLSAGGREPRGAIDLDLDLHTDHMPLRVIVTHLGLGLRERWRQANRLRQLLAQPPHRPTLLLGDFNDWLPGCPTLRPLRALCDATRHPASYPSAHPLLALDRILTCGLRRPAQVRTHQSTLTRVASDHLPIVADIDTPAGI